MDAFALPAGTDPERVEGRRSRLEKLGTGAVGDPAYTAHQRRAFDLLASGAVAKAFDLGREPPRTRDRYGRTQFGQRLLLARRLVQAGVPIVQADMGIVQTWDTHYNHYGRRKEFLLPVFDQTFGSLALDREDRGLLDATLVLVLSEHGRTPKIDAEPKGAGRDHWSRASSQVYAGGGMGRGSVVGRTDKHAGDVSEGAISPKDIPATAFYLPGIDPESTFNAPLGRPPPLTGTGGVSSGTARADCFPNSIGSSAVRSCLARSALRGRSVPSAVPGSLGDVRAKAVTMGKLADIRQGRGQLADALRIRREEELPVYERRGDVRELVVARAKIGIVLMQRAAKTQADARSRRIVPFRVELGRSGAAD